MVRQPALALEAAWLRLQFGELTQVHRCLAIAQQAVPNSPFPLGERSAASALALLQATLAWHGVTRMARDAEIAVSLEPPDEPAHAPAALCVGASLYLRGRLAEARQMLLEVVSVDSGPPSTMALALVLLAFIALEQGRLTDATTWVRRADGLMLSKGSRDTLTGVASDAARAWLAISRGERQFARGQLERASAGMYRSGAVPWVAILLGTITARVAIALDELDVADTLLEGARRQLAHFADSGRLANLLAVQERALVIARGGARVLDEPLTQAELRVLALAPTHLTLEGIGQTLHISRNTVKTHLKAIYGKLEVATRSEAVQRARDLRLLDGSSQAA
jgi:LuxR family maltose regulon positive regulatory protein